MFLFPLCQYNTVKTSTEIITVLQIKNKHSEFHCIAKIAHENFGNFGHGSFNMVNVAIIEISKVWVTVLTFIMLHEKNSKDEG